MKYNIRFLTIWFMFTLSLPFGTKANDDCDVNCISAEQWHISVAVGAGYFDSPLTNVNDGSSLTVLSDIAWYGDHWYFDNTEVGYTYFIDGLEIDSFLRLNPENWLYQQSSDINLLPVDTFASNDQEHLIDSDFIADYVTGDNVSADADVKDQSGIPPQDTNFNNTVTFDREWAGDIGLRLRYATGKTVFGLSLAHDITNVYDGYSAGLNFRYAQNIENWTLTHVVSATYKSRALVNYYYGLGETSVSSVINLKGDWFYSINSTATKPINSDWHWLLKASVTQLPGLANSSPMIERDNAIRLFAGVSYAF